MKNTVRVLLLLLSIAFFVAACVNPWAEDEKLGTVSISLSTAQRSAWDQGLLGELKGELTYEVALKHSNGTTKTITTPKGATSALAEIAPGQILGIDIIARYYGWDFAKGSSSKTFTVVAGQTTTVDAIKMQRMPSGIVMDIERGSLLDCAVFDGQLFNETITVSNYSESEMPIAFDITGIPLAISPSGTTTIAKDASVEVSFFGTSSSSGTSPNTGTIEITAGDARYHAFTLKITVCGFDSAGIQTMIDKAKSGDTIILPNENYTMNSAVEINKNITLTPEDPYSASVIMQRASGYLNKFFEVKSGALTLKMGSTDPTSIGMTLDGGSTQATPINAHESLIIVSGGSTLNIENGITLCNNGTMTNSINHGGAVNVEDGHFNITIGAGSNAQGSIINCYAGKGGGVYISNCGSFSQTTSTSDTYKTSIGGNAGAGDGNTAIEPDGGHAVYWDRPTGSGGPLRRDSTLLKSESLSTGDPTTGWSP